MRNHKNLQQQQIIWNFVWDEKVEIKLSFHRQRKFAITCCTKRNAYYT